MAKTILLVHGAWVTPACWDLFRVRLEGFGYNTLAPAWPKVDGANEVRDWDPPREFAKLTLPQIREHYAAITAGLPEPPLLVGHSVGGLVVQQLLDRGLGRAGVAIAPVAAHEVWPSWTALHAALPVLLSRRSAGCVQRLPLETFAERFAHTLTPEEQETAFAQHIIPAPAKLYVQSVFGIGNGVRIANPARAPLLLIAGEEDRIVPVNTVRALWQKYQRSPARTELRTFPGRTHWLIASPGWQEVADAVIEWAQVNR